MKMIIKEDLMLRNILGTWIVVPMGERLQEFNGMIKVNESGAFIWKLLQTENTKDKIIEAMLEEYNVDEETAIMEVDIFIKTLTEANLLEV
jgi:methyltransferase-like protein